MQRAIDNIDGIGAYLAPRPLVTVLDVKYLHLCMADGTDLYVTEHGLPFTKCLMPENHWADKAWMKERAVRLPGTSAVHRVMATIEYGYIPKQMQVDHLCEKRLCCNPACLDVVQPTVNQRRKFTRQMRLNMGLQGPLIKTNLRKPS